QKLTETLQKENLRSELELLKMQVHPHFFFNTLNNIYSFPIQQHPETPNLIHGLSTFLDYNIYTAKQDRVALETELEDIRNYMDLDDALSLRPPDIAIYIRTPIIGLDIEPKIILASIENRFKVAGPQHTDECWVSVDVTVEWDQVKMKSE